MQKPTLLIAHNKTLAAQLCNEFREYLPHNAVEYFVSYYDYYQPEAYLPASDTYIEKDSSINDDIDRLRHAATAALFARRDVVIVASVSCIYGIGSPESYSRMVLFLSTGDERPREEILRKLVEIQYQRNDVVLGRGRFRVRGDVIEMQPANMETAYRISLFGDEVESITHFDPLTGEVFERLGHLAIFPATHYTLERSEVDAALGRINAELRERLGELESQGKMLEAHRLRSRTEYDMEMLREMGFCNGIENYSRPLEGREAGTPPHTLLDYFPDDFLIVIDESHQTVPQIGGMYEGDRSRKQTLIDFGFRLPSALDNRPLRFDEFLERAPQVLFVSATPGAYELRHSTHVAEQIIRPTGLVDPEIEVRPTRHQIDDLLNEITARAEANERVLVTTLTKKMSEDLTDYLLEAGIRTRYLHSEVDTLERIKIIRELRLGEYDVLVGVNLLREGSRPARGIAGRDPRCRQGGLPARPDRLDPDDRPGGAKRQRPSDHVCRQDHRGDCGSGRRDRPSPGDPGRLQRRARNHARIDSERRLGHRRVPVAGQLAKRSGRTPAWGSQGPGHGSIRTREAGGRTRGRDVRRSRGAALRVCREASRRDQGAAPRPRCNRGRSVALIRGRPGESACSAGLRAWPGAGAARLGSGRGRD